MSRSERGGSLVPRIPAFPLAHRRMLWLVDVGSARRFSPHGDKLLGGGGMNANGHVELRLGRATVERDGEALGDFAGVGTDHAVDVAIVEVGSGAARRWLVLGVSTQSITTLHTMEPQAELPPGSVEPAATFSQLLSRLKRGA